MHLFPWNARAHVDALARCKHRLVQMPKVYNESAMATGAAALADDDHAAKGVLWLAVVRLDAFSLYEAHALGLAGRGGLEVQAGGCGRAGIFGELCYAAAVGATGDTMATRHTLYTAAFKSARLRIAAARARCRSCKPDDSTRGSAVHRSGNGTDVDRDACC